MNYNVHEVEQLLENFIHPQQESEHIGNERRKKYDEVYNRANTIIHQKGDSKHASVGIGGGPGVMGMYMSDNEIHLVTPKVPIGDRFSLHLTEILRSGGGMVVHGEYALYLEDQMLDEQPIVLFAFKKGKILSLSKKPADEQELWVANYLLDVMDQRLETIHTGYQPKPKSK